MSQQSSENHGSVNVSILVNEQTSRLIILICQQMLHLLAHVYKQKWNGKWDGTDIGETE